MLDPQESGRPVLKLARSVSMARLDLKHVVTCFARVFLLLSGPTYKYKVPKTHN
jgi:hypothetical protein